VAGSSQVSSGGLLNQGIFHAFVYNNVSRSMTDITTTAIGFAYGINDSGVVVGKAGYQVSQCQAFIYDINSGVTTSLGSLYGASGTSAAYGINNSGTVVGSTQDANGQNAAFVYSNGVMKDLNSLIDDPSVQLSAAYAINNPGQILATDNKDNAYVLTPTQTPVGPSARLINISTRAQVGIGGNILIPGFVISGSGTETLLIRADGPALSPFGVAGVLAQPSLSVFDSSGNAIAANTGWGTNPNPAEIAGTAATVGAFALPSGSADCALIVSLPAGAYTVEVSGVNSTTGIALAEIYEISSTGTRLINMSARAQVGTGANIIIAGFAISGSGSEQLLVRGDGPGLTQFGVTGVLAQPTLTLFNSSGTAIASNTGWGTGANPAQITSVDSQVGAFALSVGSADSALVSTLSPGAYTLQIAGVNILTGDALAELYEIP